MNSLDLSLYMHVVSRPRPLRLGRGRLSPGIATSRFGMLKGYEYYSYYCSSSSSCCYGRSSASSHTLQTAM